MSTVHYLGSAFAIPGTTRKLSRLKTTQSNVRAIVFLCAAALLAPGCATDDKPVASAAPAVGPAGKGSLPVLKVGATAEEIVRLVGKPLEVAPMQTPEGKAETWTYRRLVDEESSEVAEPSRAAPVIEPAHGIVSAGVQMSETEFHTVYVKTYQVTSLLMFNGKLAASKQRLEKVEKLTND